ncbi:hypothetical protein AM1_5799 [Acaryochloris marina MBIC11017]|uniref:Uncharacterized protein n=1 Tax=Acaryochloris marina (strain MBIC 11017) TaxID=329726 RepID=B0BZJ9_ACAM1|nr:hypothetical protein AM1_5799 [Acaryochloris marina MBIC11017]
MAVLLLETPNVSFKLHSGWVLNRLIQPAEQIVSSNRYYWGPPLDIL